ncbi:MAG: succinate dehydrogenase iron-sulfur subunit [Thermoanaerobacteraceae bacterium]|nr:succinate dehydrogenase iron-sulfur subunit [Thermoanaerobacteraceae bacterium]
MADTIRLKIKRQENAESQPYWEEFDVPYQKNMNVISALMEIQLNPVNAKGQKTTPVVWDCSCLEEVCGACTMIINKKARQACSALVDQLDKPIVLEPLTKFPVVCDLMVDRQIMFEYLKKVKAWIDVDGYYFAGPGPRVPEKVRRFAYDLSRCMTCGCCMEACPNVNDKSTFMGPAVIAQTRLFTLHPTGEANKEERLDAISGKGGVAECGNAQNCIQVCPKGLPLRRAIGEMNRLTFSHSLKKWLKAE